MKLPITKREKWTLTVLTALVILGLVGYAVL
jgi:hypothetical protein